MHAEGKCISNSYGWEGGLWVCFGLQDKIFIELREH